MTAAPSEVAQSSAGAAGLQTRLYLVAIAMAVVTACFWCFFNFLTAEDSLVLFNRTNFLDGAPAFFYYNGYASALPQGVAFLLSWMALPLQAVLYSAVALMVFLLLVREVFLATQSGLIALLLVTVFAVFSPFVLFNLTYSFWPGLAILGLVGLRCGDRSGPLTFRDLLICLPGLAGSPLALLYFPLFCWRALTQRAPYAAVIGIGTLISYAALVEPNGTRADGPGLLASFLANLAAMLREPLTYLVNFATVGHLAISVAGSVSVLLVIALMLREVAQRSIAAMPVVLYAAGSLAIVAAAIGAADLPLAGRYWVVIVICGLTLGGRACLLRAWPGPAWRSMRHWGMLLLAMLLCGLAVSSMALRVEKWGGLAPSLADWRLLSNPPVALTAIHRHWHENGANWAIGVGQNPLPYSDCAGHRTHPESFARYGFHIYCGGPDIP